MSNLNTLAVDIPDVQFDPSTPGLTGLVQIASWVLSIGLVLGLLFLIIALIGMATRGFGNERVQGFIGDNILRVFIVVGLLAGVNGLFQLFVGFDWGLG